jgi:G patch domain-containing protein 1
MDDEDLADLEGSRRLGTKEEFAGLGTITASRGTPRGLADLLRPRGDTIGIRLLRKMGWKDGQGIGPRVSRAARTGDDGQETTHTHMVTTKAFLFAPNDIPILSSSRKADRHGLGFPTEGADGSGEKRRRGLSHDTGPQQAGATPSPTRRGGIGVGVLNDSGSDEEDPYEVGPKITHIRSVKAAKKAKKPKREAGNAAAGSVSKLAATLLSAARTRGETVATRLVTIQMDGFVLSSGHLWSLPPPHPIPRVPPDWVPFRQRRLNIGKPVSLQEASGAGAVPHNPASRANMLGEAPLSGKSVFDFMTPSARDRLVAATGNCNLPPGRGEMVMSAGSGVPVNSLQPEKAAAAAALERDRSGRSPYASNAEKRSRYRRYLEYHAGVSSAFVPRPKDMSEKDFAVELDEFFNCVGIFKPMTGFMASRFTTSSPSQGPPGTDSRNTAAKKTSVPTSIDAATEAAKLGMFGAVTRTTTSFYPTRLLCKRFNVAVPPPITTHNPPRTSPPLPLSSSSARRHGAVEEGDVRGISGARLQAPISDVGHVGHVDMGGGVGSAVHQSRPPDHVFRAIFGDSSDED